MENKIKVIASKSQAHRALICSYLASIGKLENEMTKVIFHETSKDIIATENCLSNMKKGEYCKLQCNESGSTLRFLLPLVGALGLEGEFLPMGRLSERPLSPLYEELEKHGMKMSRQGEVPFKFQGKLISGDYTLAGNISSQFISGLLFALPLLDGYSRIIIEGELESKAYVEMTLEMLSNFGVEVVRQKYGFKIKGGQKFSGPKEIEVEGDWSNGGFILCAGSLLEEGLLCTNLNLHSSQGDRKIIEILRNMGANLKTKGDTVSAAKGRLLGGTIDVKDIPDLVPAIAVVAAVSEGTTEIINAGRLRLKESDRLMAVTTVLNILGARVKELKDGLVIEGVPRLNGGVVDSYGDHRIAMMAAIASIVSDEEVVIENSKAVEKSYTNFYEDIRSLGDKVKVVEG